MIQQDYLAKLDDNGTVVPIRDGLQIGYGVTYVETRDPMNSMSVGVKLGGLDFKDAPTQKHKMTKERLHIK